MINFILVYFFGFDFLIVSVFLLHFIIIDKYRNIWRCHATKALETTRAIIISFHLQINQIILMIYVNEKFLLNFFYCWIKIWKNSSELFFSGERLNLFLFLKFDLCFLIVEWSSYFYLEIRFLFNNDKNFLIKKKNFSYDCSL